MQYTVIGVWLADKPVVTGHHEVYGGDEETFTEGVWATFVTAGEVAEAEQLAKTDMVENNI